MRLRLFKRPFFIILMSALLFCCFGCFNNAERSGQLVVKYSNLCGLGIAECFECKPLEKDKYGRQMMSFKFQNDTYAPYDLWTYGMAIIQKCDGEDTFFYEDTCFVLSKYPITKTGDKADVLKKTNDWDMPLKIEKCSAISNAQKERFVFKSEYIYDELEIKCAESGLNMRDVRAVSTDGNGNELYLLNVQDVDKKEISSYAVIANRYAKDGDLRYNMQKIDDVYAYQEQLHKLKQQSSWKFGGK